MEEMDVEELNVRETEFISHINEKVISNDYLNFYRDRKFVDIELRCLKDDKCVFAHKCILQAESRVFDELISQTPTPKIIYLDISSADLDVMLRFMYNNQEPGRRMFKRFKKYAERYELVGYK